MKISCLGPEGSYSFLAARAMRPDDEIILCETFPVAAQTIESGGADGVVLPIENSIQGAVLQNLDVIEKFPDLYAIEEHILKIDHRLATKAGAKKEDIKTIYSHSQALSQCGEYLLKNFPSVRQIPTNSTAESLNKITDFSSAGIVGAHMKREGIVLSEENIADEKENFTHFLLFVKGENNFREHTSKIFFCATTFKDEPGTLLKLLQVMYIYDLNMTKIESRPIKNRLGEYRFFIEFQGDRADWKVRKALDDIKEHCLSFQLIGMY